MPIKIFFCYAREDEILLDKLKIQLKPLLRQGVVDTWHDRDIEAGTEWEREISQHLNTAQIILLLISPDFMNSDYCYGVEMKRALERHKQGEAHIIPIILRPVHWQEEPLQTLQALPTDAKPVKSWSDLDEALFNVADGIRKVIKEQWLKKSKDYYNTEFYGEALQAITQGIRLDSRDSRLYKVKGEVLSKLKRSEDALEAFEQSIKLEPNNADAHLSKATLLNELGQYQDALQASECVIALDASHASAYYAKGLALQKLARYQDAVNAYELATQFDTNLREAYEGVGQIQSQLQRYEEALAAYQKAIKLQPDSASLLAAQGRVLHALGRDQEALTAFEDAIAFESSDANLYREKANVLQLLKRPDDARAAYQKARQLGEGSSLIEIVVESTHEEENTKPGVISLKEKMQDRHLHVQITKEDSFASADKDGGTPLKHISRLYNLIQSIITGLGASIAMVVISELIEDNLYGNIVLKIIDKQVEVDAHVADLIAFAIHTKSPIFIEEDVLERASSRPIVKDETRDIFLNFKEAMLALESVLREKEAAIQQQEYDHAAELRDREVKLRDRIAKLEVIWQNERDNEKPIANKKAEVSMADEEKEILALSNNTDQGKFDKFTNSARKVLSLAQEEAQRFQHNSIGTEHLLLGLVREREGVAGKVLVNLGVELNKVRSAVEFIIGRGDRIVLGEIGLTPRGKKVIELAVDEARRMNHHYIGTHHLLLGLVHEGEGIAAGVLENLGIELENVRAQTTKTISYLK